MTDETPRCRFVASDAPRVLPGRHERACEDPACLGCQACPERHCSVCGRQHVTTGTCAECVAATRDDLHTIATVCGSPALLTEAVHRGVEGEAMMLLGPTADPEGWRNRAMSAILGRLPDGYLEDCRDEKHPLWVLGTWEQLYREHLDQPTDLGQTIDRAAAYLSRQLHILGALEEPPFEDFARDVRSCRGHLEDVLRDGVREERGAPCPKCGGMLVKDYGHTEEDDRWRCKARTCREWWTERDYRAKVSATYEHHADRLPASAIARVYRVPEGTVRKWAERGHVRKRGTDQQGRMLYLVADVVAMRQAEAS